MNLACVSMHSKRSWEGRRIIRGTVVHRCNGALVGMLMVFMFGVRGFLSRAPDCLVNGLRDHPDDVDAFLTTGV